MYVSNDPPGSNALRSFRVEAPGFSICVAADCSRTLELVESYLLPWLPRVSASSEAADVNVVLRRSSPAGFFQFEVNDRAFAQSETMPYLFTLVQQAADEAMIRTLRHKAAIHAGTIVHQGKAIVLPGPSGSGKSRLVQELLLQGAEYCSDEYAILDAHGCAHPYPRPLMIRRDGLEQQPVLASELQAKVCERPAPVSLLLFLRYEPGAAGLHVRPLDRSESLLRLLQNTPQVMAEKPDVLDPLKAAVSGAASYEGVRGEISDAAAEILRLAAAV